MAPVVSHLQAIAILHSPTNNFVLEMIHNILNGRFSVLFRLTILHTAPFANRRCNEIFLADHKIPCTFCQLTKFENIWCSSFHFMALPLKRPCILLELTKV